MNKILIIDDEKDLCEVLKLILTRDRLEVDCAYNLNEAGFKLKKKPEIILLDNNLPDGSGLTYLQNNPGKFKNSTVILISADANQENEPETKVEGISRIIRKPFTLKVIRDAVKEITTGSADI